MSRVKVKTCGLFRSVDIEYANEVSPDYIGFIFWAKSHRYVTYEKAKELRSHLAGHIIPVGVFVNEDPDRIVAAVKDGSIDMIQLHGTEDEDEIRLLREKLAEAGKDHTRIIKAFQVKTEEDLDQALASSADYILLDGGMGNGRTFDWELLKRRREEIKRPFFLAGGIGPENAVSAASFSPFAIDASSSLETDKQKDLTKMRAFAEAVRRTVNE